MFLKRPGKNLRKLLLLFLSSGLLLVLLGGSFWLNQQLKITIKDLIVWAQDIYDPEEPESSPPPAESSPSPPPAGGTCGDGSCGGGENSSSCPQDCIVVEVCENQCSGVCCDDGTCSGSEMGCWPDLPPGAPGTGCTSSSDCSCSCPPGYDCEAAICGSNGGCYSSCTPSGGGGGGDGGCTDTPPDPPQLVSPSTNSNLFAPTLTFDWGDIADWGTNCSGNNNYYILYVDYYSPPSTSQCSASQGQSTCNISKDASHEWLFQPGVRYYWRVAAANGARINSSPTWTYMIGGEISGQVYQDETPGICGLTTPVTNGGWTVTCDGVNARQDSTTEFTCLDSQGSTALSEGSHSLAITPPSEWLFSCDPQLGTATLSSGTPNISDYSLMLTEGRYGWFQTQGGDVYANASGGETIRSQIPDTCTELVDCEPYFSLRDITTNQPGSVSRAGGDENFRSGSVSEESWSSQAGDYEGIQADYSFWRRYLGEELEEKEVNSDPGAGFWLSTGGETLTISSDWNVADGEKVVVIHDGNILVGSNMTVASGGSLMLVASGTITFESGADQNVQGIYIANTISTGSSVGVSLQGEGSFIAWSGFSLSRDLEFDNRIEPAEVFIYRPDIVYNLPTEVKRPFYTWREKAY